MLQIIICQNNYGPANDIYQWWQITTLLQLEKGNFSQTKVWIAKLGTQSLNNVSEAICGIQKYRF